MPSQVVDGWGIQPEKMIGHSIGEFVAATCRCLLRSDALKLLAVRGRLIQDLPGGSMLAVPLPEQEICLLGPLVGCDQWFL